MGKGGQVLGQPRSQGSVSSSRENEPFFLEGGKESPGNEVGSRRVFLGDVTAHCSRIDRAVNT